MYNCFYFRDKTKRHCNEPVDAQVTQESKGVYVWTTNGLKGKYR